MGGRLLAELNPTSAYPVNRQGFPSLMPHDQDLPGYASFNPPPRQLGHLGNTFPPQIPTYNPALPGMPMEPGARSSNMEAQEGPPFEDTKVIYPVLTARNQQLTPKIEAKIQKGFFKVDQKWTCYRRNYFTVSCSFSLKPATYEPQFYLQRHANQQHEPIMAFAMQISAKTAVVNNQESDMRNLVQHTPKRDKATESVPGKVMLSPAQPAMLTNPASYHGNNGMYGTPSGLTPNMMVDYNPQQYSSVQHQGPPQNHTFERIQFQKATANNGKRRAQQQYFHVVVELFADVGRHGDRQWIKIASVQSHPMVVRGRSPGHYKDNRRDSSTSMDRDRGAGAGGDVSGAPSVGSYLSPSHGRSSTMDWESTHRGSSQMGGSYRHMAEDCSPQSPASLESSTSSCGELNFDFLRGEGSLDTSKFTTPDPPLPGSIDQKALASLLGLRSRHGFENSRPQASTNQSCFAIDPADDQQLESPESSIYHPKRLGTMDFSLQQALCTS